MNDDFYKEQIEFVQNRDNINEIISEYSNFLNNYLKNNFKDWVDEWLITFIEAKWDKEKIIKYINYIMENNPNNLGSDDLFQLANLKKTLIKNELSSINHSIEKNRNIETHLNFTIEAATAKIRQIWWSKKYILNNRYNPVIKKVVWQQWMYYTKLVMKRDSKSSLRWNIEVTLNFYYDWKKIIFFNDRNKNNSYDIREWWILNNTKNQQWVYIKDYRWWVFISRYWKNKIISLDKNYITSPNVKEMKIKLDFN